jgi:hypothetical protein
VFAVTGDAATRGGAPASLSTFDCVEKNFSLKPGLVTPITRTLFETALSFPTNAVLFMRDGGDHEEIHADCSAGPHRDRDRAPARDL